MHTQHQILLEVNKKSLKIRWDALQKIKIVESAVILTDIVNFQRNALIYSFDVLVQCCVPSSTTNTSANKKSHQHQLNLTPNFE